MNREDFPMLRNNIIYFDNGATTLKPQVMIDSITDYYTNYSANAYRGDYDISVKVDAKCELTRSLVSDFINSPSSHQVVFTSGATDSLNKVIFGYFANNLSKGDEVILTRSEHASNILPWFELKDNLGIEIKYIDLDDNFKVTIDNLKKVLTNKTKVISLAIITNVVGDYRPIKEIVKLAHENDILVLADASQSIAHSKTDVLDIDIDFLVFSAHKMCGPTGLGIIYGKENLLNDMQPIIYGGGMNSSFTNDGVRIYSNIPKRFEAGTPNVASIIGYGETIKYLNSIGMDKIEAYEKELKEYLVTRLKEIDKIIVYNNYSDSAI